MKLTQTSATLVQTCFVKKKIQFDNWFQSEEAVGLKRLKQLVRLAFFKAHKLTCYILAFKCFIKRERQFMIYKD